MTLAEKAGQLFHTMIFLGAGGELSEADGRHDSTEALVGEKLMSHFNLVGSVENVKEAAEWRFKPGLEYRSHCLPTPGTISPTMLERLRWPET
jgi:beta-glucosidase